MKKTGSFLAVYALEQIGIKFTFGIPGVHNTELYDALNSSEKITPVLVTHEGCASFMADGVSRTSETVGTLAIVPAAGTTHAMSGIGEAFLDGSPMLIISGGTRRDSGRHYQLHQLDLKPVVGALVKKYFLIEKHSDIIPMIYEAYNIATSGEPGPVFIEIPVEIQMFQGDVDSLPEYKPQAKTVKPDLEKIKQAARLLATSKKPGIYVGWGAVEAGELTIKIAEKITAPVCTPCKSPATYRSGIWPCFGSGISKCV
jgi:acetolactate synthase I/II/III large subunit